jgi:phenylpropionate dioxygenase-like ring-hydroxylating dioxygenase large terminal subunit
MSEPQAILVKALSAAAYIDAEVYRQEQNRIFARSWQFACHVEKLRCSGDFVVCEVADESLIVMRENEKVINAFYNVCAHRAARLLDGEGCKQRFSCPYHAWIYNTRGELVAAPNAGDVPGFDVSHFGLKSCRVEVVHGLVFVCLDNDAEPLQAQFPGLIDDLKAYAPDLPALTFVHRTEACMQANWKVAIENYAECYHCELIHKALVSGVLDFDSYSIEVIGKAHKHLSRSQSGTARAYDFDESTDSEFVAWWMWPNFSFQSYPGGRVHFWKWTPVDASHTHLTVDWFFPSKDMADWEREMIDHHARTTFAEDLAVIDSVQQGLGSRSYQPGPLMIDRENSRYSEHAVAAIQQLWRNAMGDAYE